MDKVSEIKIGLKNTGGSSSGISNDNDSKGIKFGEEFDVNAAEGAKAEFNCAADEMGEGLVVYKVLGDKHDKSKDKLIKLCVFDKKSGKVIFISDGKGKYVVDSNAKKFNE